jgi:hypothetical protein
LVIVALRVEAEDEKAGDFFPVLKFDEIEQR